MPFDLAPGRDTVAPYNRSSMRECDPPQAAFATMEEVRRAHELWLQLRDRLLRRPVPLIRPWSVGVD